MKMLRMVLILVLATVLSPAVSAQRYITVASTTSTENSGLFDVLLPRFFAQSGIQVRVVAVGTGQAIKNAENGDADVLLVHHKESELNFVAEGFGVRRFDVMYNDFVLVGPRSDPAGVKNSKDITAAMRRIEATRQAFASRGDDSGTHKKERSLWIEAQVDPDAASGRWYRETGSGMGATLNVANGMGAYTLTDRATWLKFANKGALDIVFEGDERLFNQYGVTLVNPLRYPHVKRDDGQMFVDWLISARGQQLINRYEIKGKQAFFANAK